ncbi:serine/threonine kinase 10 [Paragonimus westermani]|uniref:Serine/threonine kinase 10 n=1 Tax=Paragonimus westermani TaxID=34504 RepID=A0A5J4NTN7_9TREM|nr:serine/threonine kinase 10 [Paragonimus westermani]
MTFLKGLLKKLKTPDEQKRKGSSGSIKRDVNPEDMWEIVNELGDGAFGKVYKTKRKVGDMQAALKKVEFDSESELEDFMVEIEILTEFKHPNILSLLEVYIFSGRLWMFLELCSGGALDSIMNSLDKPLTEPQIRFVSREVLSGLGFLHENLIIHRDMKAGNILLTASNEIKLADFGVSARLSNEKQKRSTFIGTPYWMAPEVIACEALKESPYNWKADIWSFGITLIELAQMRPPHNEINPTRVLLKITKSDPPALTKPHLWSPEFSNMLAKCLQKDPDKRADCSVLLTDAFVRNVTEDDRKYIRLLLCELKADVVDVVEDLDPAEVLGEEQLSENVLVLPDSTTIEIPLEVVEDEDEGLEADVDEKELDQGGEFESDGFSVAPAKPDPELLDKLTGELADKLIEDVVTSETRHPSVPSCLFEVMRELSESVEPTGNAVSFSDTSLKPAPIQPKGITLHRQCSAYRTVTRTRRFIIDGKEVTTTSKRIIPANVEERKRRDEELNKRKAELRAFRLLGKREVRQTRELTARAANQKEQLESKLSAEFMVLKRSYEQKLEVVSRNYRAQLERLEKEHDADAKRIRVNNAREEQLFKERLRAELEKYSRAERKAAKRELQADQPASLSFSTWSATGSSLTSLQSTSSSTGSVINKRLSMFREEQDARLYNRLYQLTVHFNTRLNNLRQEELVEKQAIRMNFEQEKWKMDQRHMRMRHQLARNKLQDFFSVKRQKLAGLLELELAELRQTITQERNKLNIAHAIERKNHAKYAKGVSKKTLFSFQRQLRVGQQMFTSQFKDRLRELEEATRKQLTEESLQIEQRQHQQQEMLEVSILTRLRELEQSHAAKRNDLIDLEAERLQELDGRHESELRAYVESLPHNQAFLRAQFAEELASLSRPVDFPHPPEGLPYNSNGPARPVSSIGSIQSASELSHDSSLRSLSLKHAWSSKSISPPASHFRRGAK